MKPYDYYKSLWTVKHIRAGQVIWEDVGYNSLVQEGEESILETFFRAYSAYTPSNFYIRLCNDNLLITDTLLTVSGEASGNGYAPQLVERSTTGFPTKLITPDGRYQIESKVVTFTASGGTIGPVTTAFLASTSDNTGDLIAFRPLSMTRTILSGDSMTLQFKVNLG